MSITPQFLDELRSRVPISSVVGRFVSWDTRKSSPGKGDFWAPCPFHQEKTASFHVDDRKGFYYCFGCHAKGDAIGFLKDKGNLEFVDAVRELAGMAGMAMPEWSPQQKAKVDRNAHLIAMHEAAARFFTQNLNAAAGAQARSYLKESRKLSDTTISKFHLGFALNSRDALTLHLREAGFQDDDLVEGGLAIKPDDGGAIFDRFRHRIMFPIQDGRGRVVAFGGRAMDPNARAKYLNSSDSPIFHKGRIVYNISNARTHIRNETHFLITEGYMDVIALAQAGFENAIAPMGTALTEEQLDMIWRIDPLPFAAFDGDMAGQRAAGRLAELALPKLAANRSINFIMMPEGLDPDEFLQANGVAAFRALIAEATPMVSRLWNDALGGQALTTPEARASFDQRLRAYLDRISDANLRTHYRAEFADRRQALFERKRSFEKQSYSPSKSPSYARKQIPSPPIHGDDRFLALVLKVLCAHPQLVSEFADQLAALTTSDQALTQLRRNLLLDYDKSDAIAKIDQSALAPYSAIRRVEIARADANEAQVRLWLNKELDLRERRAGLDAEIAEIKGELREAGMDEELSKRLRERIEERDALLRFDDQNQDNHSDNKSFLLDMLESGDWRK